MRYHGQNYELSVALPDGAITPATHAGAGGRLRRRAPPALRLRRRRRSGAARHPARRGDRHRCARPSFKAHPDAGPDASAAIVQQPRGLAGRGAATSSPRRSTPASACSPGNRFAGPAIVEQMDATTLVPPGMTARVDRVSQPDPGGGMNARRNRRRPDHRRGDRRRHGLDRRGDRRDADPRLAFDQHQGAARLLDGAVQRRRRDAVPGRAHPDPSRQLPRPRAAHHAALPDPGHPAGRRLHRQRRLRGRRHASARHRAGRADLRRRPAWSPGRSTSRTMPTSSIAATPTSTRRACASRRCGSIAPASCRRTCRT